MLVKILMIDDHQVMIDGYKAILSICKDKYTIETTDVNTCEKAHQEITNPANVGVYEVVFLDYSLPAYPEKKIFNGEDLAVLIKKHWPTTKIIMLTAHFDAIKLFNIVKKVAPNGLLVKSDFQAPQLLKAFETVLNGDTYFSPLVHERIKERLFADGLMDSTDREIINLINEGLQIKSIATKMLISEDTVKKRKTKIKDLLGIEKGSDEAILKECKLLGLL
jgi:DNA-binding NarL/FixJ family response regulator